MRGAGAVGPLVRGAVPLGAAGFAGSVLVAVGSYGGGTLERIPELASAPRPGNEGAGRWVCLAGIAVVIVCWLLLGRRVLAGTASLPAVLAVCGVWGLPMLAAAPFGSRDVWAYGAQGELYRHGLDPYRDGPVAWAGHFLAYVSPEWRAAPSPYGPAWLPLAALAAAVAGTHLLVALLVTRVLCAAGLVLVALTLPRLAARFGGSPVVAAWLFCANPVILIVSLGGAHNDLLMAGLMTLGLWLAVSPGPARRSLVLAAVVLAVAAEIKLPAACALAFLPHLWLRFAPAAQAWRERRAAGWEVSAAVAAVAAATAGLTALATGLGFGWVHQLNAGESGALWLSVPVVVAYLWTVARGDSTHLHDVAVRYPHPVAVVTSVLAVGLVGLWLAGRRVDPVRLLAIALAVGVIAATTVQPWYAAWALPVAAAITTRRRTVALLAALSTFASLCLIPNGSSYLVKPLAVPIAAIAIALVVALLGIRAEPREPRAQSRVRSTSRSPSA